MNIYSFDVSFSTGVISSPYFTLVVNDHNSTTFKFTFDQDGRHVFKLLYPDGTYYVQDITNDELILGNGVLNQSGNYKFEISLYGEDNRLTTSLTQEFAVRLELVDTDELVNVDDRVPVLDNLIEETNTILQEAKDGKFDGATFTPNVSESGDLSWSNDKGKENPPTVNIMGPPGEPGAVKMQVVDVLPETGETDTIYLVKKSIPNEQNLYDEYVYANGTWEHIGDTSVDLSDYYTKSETDNKLNEKQNTLTAGENITIDENNVISASGVNTPEFFIDIPSVSINTSDRYETYTLSDDFNSQLTTIINNIFGTYQRFTVMFLVNYVLAKFKPSVMSYSDGRGTLKLNTHPYEINLYAVINTNTATSATNADPVIFGGYIPLTLTIRLSWDSDIALVTKSTFKMFGYSGTIPSIDYMRGKTLFKDNTTSYAPTKDYHPATKKYVDDNKYELPIASADTLGGIKIGEGLSADENGVVSASGNTLTCLEDKNVFVLSLDKNKNSNVNTLTYASGCNDSEICGYFSEILTKIMPKKSGILILTLLNYGADSTHQNSYVFNWYYGSNKFYGLVHDYFGVQINYLEFTYTTTDNVVNVSKVYLKSDVIKTNRAPTNNDHLTNKKYVDDKPTTYTGYDATKTQILKNINGTLTWVDET